MFDNITQKTSTNIAPKRKAKYFEINGRVEDISLIRNARINGNIKCQVIIEYFSNEVYVISYKTSALAQEDYNKLRESLCAM